MDLVLNLKSITSSCCKVIGVRVFMMRMSEKFNTPAKQVISEHILYCMHYYYYYAINLRRSIVWARHSNRPNQKRQLVLIIITGISCRKLYNLAHGDK